MGLKVQVGDGTETWTKGDMKNLPPGSASCRLVLRSLFKENHSEEF